MSNKSLSNRELAACFIENHAKDAIVSAVFDHFKLDCLERCHINPSRLDRLIKEFLAGDRCDVEILTAIIDLIKTGQVNFSNKENDLVRKITDCVLEGLTEERSIEQIAQKLNISYYYMCHIFKNKRGISVNSFRTQKRLELAMKRLLQSDEKIADIAAMCGSNNLSYFTETFTKTVGVSPTQFKKQNQGMQIHPFYDFDDILLAAQLEGVEFLDPDLKDISVPTQSTVIHKPDDAFTFLHETAIIEYHGVLYASWYHNRKKELQGYTPICGKRSYDGGKTWSDIETICDDKTEKVMYCPPVYGICDDRLYMLVNQMLYAPDHMHALDLYILNNETQRFELVWSRPIPFKLNTNVIPLPNGKRMLPGRIAELDGFPNTPAVLLSDDGKIDTQWRLVKLAENGNMPDGTKLVHPEISVMCVEDTLYMFCRNDQRKVPLVYLSNDWGESWSNLYRHDVPCVSTKVYAGNLSDGRNYLIANIDRTDRSRLAIYFTEKNSKTFTKRMILFDKETDNPENAEACHYPCAYESGGKLYITATLNYEYTRRGAVLFTIDLQDV